MIPNSTLQVLSDCVMADYTRHHWSILYIVFQLQYLAKSLAAAIGYHNDQSSTPQVLSHRIIAWHSDSLWGFCAGCELLIVPLRFVATKDLNSMNEGYRQEDHIFVSTGAIGVWLPRGCFMCLYRRRFLDDILPHVPFKWFIITITTWKP